MKKNILIISGFYPTNGILSLINYFSYSLIDNKNFNKEFNLKILIFNENFSVKIKKFFFNLYLSLKNLIFDQKNRIHDFAYSPKAFLNENPKLKKKIIFYSKDVEIINLKPSLIFPIYFPIKKENIKSIGYIYDFQHLDLPGLFTKKEIDLRNRLFSKIIMSNKSIFVNSNFIKKKILSKYDLKGKKIIKIPFLPYHFYNNEKKDFSQLKKIYNIKNNYFIICNHFWKHKNHELAFKAFEKFLKFYPDYQLICTGGLFDSRHPEYFIQLKKKYQKIIDSNRILILGNINKDDQIELLKNSLAVVQPTSYEGGPGGFSAYEAIAYKKYLLLSDIPVNKEAKGKNVIFFKNNSSNQLLKKLISIINKKKTKTKNKNNYDNSKINKKKLGYFLYNFIKKLI